MSLPDRRDRSFDLLLPASGLAPSVRPELPQADVEMLDMADFIQAQADFELVPMEYQGTALDPSIGARLQERPGLPQVPPSPDRSALEASRPTAEETDAAVAHALLESERLDEAEAALAAADAAVRDAEQSLQQLRRAQSEQRLRTDAQRGRTIQARLMARSMSLRHARLEPTAARPGPDDPRDAQSAVTSALEADAPGFQPTLPLGDTETTRAVLREASILTVLPTQRRQWADAANRPRVGKVLVEGQRLTALDVEMVLMHQSTQQRRFGEIAVALGLLEAADVIWALRHQQPEKATGVPGTGPSAEGDLLVLRDEPGSAAARVIRDIAGQLVERRRGTPGGQALAIVSASVGDGKSTLAANLSMALAERGKRVLLVDSDFEGSRIHQLLPSLPPSGGLAAVIRGEQRMAEAVVQPRAWRSADLHHGFHLLPAARPGAGQPLPSAEVARSGRYARMVERAVQHYDFVLLDAPAASRGAATRRLARLAATALVVARPGRTPNASLDSLTLELRRAEAAVLGVVMNSH